MASLSNSSDLKPDGLITRAVDWVFGYDFFISYNHGDGMRLPRRLRERLEHAGFRVFLDQTEYVAGEDLGARRAVRWSRAEKSSSSVAPARSNRCGSSARSTSRSPTARFR